MDNEKENFQKFLDEHTDHIEQWPTSKLKKEAGESATNDKSIVRDDLGIE